MKVTLKRAYMTDCKKIHKMQMISFKDLLDKYGDINTNPGAESLEKIIFKMNQNFTDYYFIQFHMEPIGVIRLVRLQGNICRISPMFILPQFQGRGFTKQTMIAVEALYPQAVGWQLETIKEESKLCYFYEKMGYKKTGKEEQIQDTMTIVYYAK